MKFRIEVDCTPAEARAFLGLPDVAPMQQGVMKELDKRVRDNLKYIDPQEIVRLWLTSTVRGVEEVRSLFGAGIGAAARGKRGAAPE